MTNAVITRVSLFIVLLLSGCEGVDNGPDFTPLGNGLAFIGLAIVLAALIRVIGGQWAAPTKTRKEESDEKLQ